MQKSINAPASHLLRLHQPPGRRCVEECVPAQEHGDERNRCPVQLLGVASWSRTSDLNWSTWVFVSNPAIIASTSPVPIT